MHDTVTSKALRALQQRRARIESRIEELLDLESAAGGGAKAQQYYSERQKLIDEQRELDEAMHAETRRIISEAGLDGSKEPISVIGSDGRERPYQRAAHGTRVMGRRYADMFGAPRASDFKAFGEMIGLLQNGLSDRRLVAAVAGGSEGVGADGGFLVPPEFAATLMDASLENEIVRPRARSEPMKYSSKTVAGLDTQDHSADIGGLTGVWIGENQSLTGQKPRFRVIVLQARKLGILLPMSNELLADAQNADEQVSRVLTAAISWYLDYAFLNGDGAGQPKGVLSDSALIVVNKESGQAAATITYENIKAMYTRLHPACVPNACWIVNQGARAQMLGLVQYVKNAAGTDFVGGSGVPIVKQGANGEMSLLGLPLLFTEKVPALGTQGDILLSDLSQYIAGMRAEMEIMKSEHLYFDSAATAYRILLRADGRGAWSKAMTPKNGSTLSWCVTLQAR